MEVGNLSESCIKEERERERETEGRHIVDGSIFI
jgi:hypothetical protein